MTLNDGSFPLCLCYCFVSRKFVSVEIEKELVNVCKCVCVHVFYEHLSIVQRTATLNAETFIWHLTYILIFLFFLTAELGCFTFSFIWLVQVIVRCCCCCCCGRRHCSCYCCYGCFFISTLLLKR